MKNVNLYKNRKNSIMTLKVPIISCSAFKHIHQLDSYGPLYNPMRDNGVNISCFTDEETKGQGS